LFKPKVYKSNGLEAYHLINDEGGSFLYEGSVEYSEEELFKDEQGKTFYLVTTEIGGTTKYYVEVEAEGKPIPAAAVDKKEKDISDLVLASPREYFPEERRREQEPPEPAPMQHDVSPRRDTCFDGPETIPSDIPEKVVEELRQKPAEPQPTAAEEAQAAVKAMASLGDHRPQKRTGIFSLPVIAAVIIAVIVIVAAGIIIFKPVSGFNLPFTSQPTPTPVPEITVTPAPTAEPTPTPQPTADVQPGSYSDLVPRLTPLVAALNSNDTAVMAFANDTANPTGTSFTKLALVCDLYDGVNNRWSVREYNGTPQLVNDSIQTMTGSLADYSVLMAALAEAEGMDSRVVVAYDENGKNYVYYPEVKVATNSSGYSDATTYLRARYDIQDPFNQTDGNDHWLSLAIGKNPGLYVNSGFALTINSRRDVQPV